MRISDITREFQDLPSRVRYLVGGGLAAGVMALLFLLVDSSRWIVLGLLVVVLLSGVVALLRRWHDRRKSRRLEATLFDEAGDSPLEDAEVRARIKDAERRWTQAREDLRRQHYDYYRVPWFLVIGPSQSGKTTMIQRSTQHSAAGEEPVPDRTASWHFFPTKKAMLVDTAGRYVDALGRHKKEFDRLLQRLRECRPRSPVNGLILVVRAEEILKDSDELAPILSGALRNIEEELGIRCPVYVVVTKCDRLSGFVEFFTSARRTSNLDALFGWSRPGEPEGRLAEEDLDAGFRQLRARVEELRVAHLADDGLAPRAASLNQKELDRLYAFPALFSDRLDVLRKLLLMVFGSQRIAKDFMTHDYVPAHFLRGVYFTSAIQKGSPDSSALLRVLGEEFAQPEEEDLSKRVGRSQAYFIRDLFEEKILREQGLVRPTEQAERRRKLTRKALIAAASVAAFGIVGWAVKHAFDLGSEDISDLAAEIGNAESMQQGATWTTAWAAFQKPGLSALQTLHKDVHTTARVAINRLAIRDGLLPVLEAGCSLLANAGLPKPRTIADLARRERWLAKILRLSVTEAANGTPSAGPARRGDSKPVEAGLRSMASDDEGLIEGVRSIVADIRSSDTVDLKEALQGLDTRLGLSDDQRRFLDELPEDQLADYLKATKTTSKAAGDAYKRCLADFEAAIQFVMVEDWQAEDSKAHEQLQAEINRKWRRARILGLDRSLRENIKEMKKACDETAQVSSLTDYREKISKPWSAAYADYVESDENLREVLKIESVQSPECTLEGLWSRIQGTTVGPARSLVVDSTWALRSERYDEFVRDVTSGTLAGLFALDLASETPLKFNLKPAFEIAKEGETVSKALAGCDPIVAFTLEKITLEDLSALKTRGSLATWLASRAGPKPNQVYPENVQVILNGLQDKAQLAVHWRHHVAELQDGVNDSERFVSAIKTLGGEKGAQGPSRAFSSEVTNIVGQAWLNLAEELPSLDLPNAWPAAGDVQDKAKTCLDEFLEEVDRYWTQDIFERIEAVPMTERLRVQTLADLQRAAAGIASIVTACANKAREHGHADVDVWIGAKIPRTQGLWRLYQDKEHQDALKKSCDEFQSILGDLGSEQRDYSELDRVVAKAVAPRQSISQRIKNLLPHRLNPEDCYLAKVGEVADRLREILAARAWQDFCGKWAGLGKSKPCAELMGGRFPFTQERKGIDLAPHKHLTEFVATSEFQTLYRRVGPEIVDTTDSFLYGKRFETEPQGQCFRRTYLLVRFFGLPSGPSSEVHLGLIKRLYPMRTVEIPDSYKLEIGRESQWFPLAESAVQALRFKFDAPLTRILSKDESVVGRNPLRAALAEDHRRDSQDYDQWSLLGYYYLGESASGIEGERSGRKITLDLVKAQLNSAQEAKAPSSWKLTLFLWTDPALPDELPDFVSANFSFQ